MLTFIRLISGNWLMYESLQQWLGHMNQYGWILFFPCWSGCGPCSRNNNCGLPGLISDVVHVYQSFTPFLIAGVAVYAASLHVNPGGVGEFLGISPWYFSLVVGVILFSEVTFYIVHRLTHAILLLWEFHRVHHSPVNLDSFSTHRFHILDKALFGYPTFHSFFTSRQIPRSSSFSLPFSPCRNTTVTPT